MMQELIDRQAALKNICKYCAEAKCKKNECMVFAGIKDTPTAEPIVLMDGDKVVYTFDHVNTADGSLDPDGEYGRMR